MRNYPKELHGSKLILTGRASWAIMTVVSGVVRRGWSTVLFITFDGA